MYKTCSKCDTHKNISQFHKLKSGKFGVHSICKQCRSISRKRYNYEIINKEKVCKLCNLPKKFYKNKSSKDGLQTYCIDCQKKKISKSKSKLENFCKIILEKFKKKHKNIKINITISDLIKKYKEQNGKCFITKHSLTHEVDIKQRTDNIWNLSIIHNSNEVNYETFNLGIHLIYTLKNLYQIDDILKVYNCLVL